MDERCENHAEPEKPSEAVIFPNILPTKEIIDMWQKLTQQEIDDFNPYGDYDFLNNINSNSENDSTITQVSDSSTNNILGRTLRQPQQAKIISENEMMNQLKKKKKK